MYNIPAAEAEARASSTQGGAVRESVGALCSLGHCPSSSGSGGGNAGKLWPAGGDLGQGQLKGQQCAREKYLVAILIWSRVWCTPMGRHMPVSDSSLQKE